jgi:HAE1 family hydrophobic/amphiphilic exporter-1
MTSFAFIAGLLPLVVAAGAGAIGNRAIGTTGAGGMLVGTVIGVLIIPGLYYLFGRLDGGRKLIKDESDEPLSEIFQHGAQSARDRDRLQHPAGAAVLHSQSPSPGPAPLLPNHFNGATGQGNSSPVV